MDIFNKIIYKNITENDKFTNANNCCAVDVNVLLHSCFATRYVHLRALKLNRVSSGINAAGGKAHVSSGILLDGWECKIIILSPSLSQLYILCYLVIDFFCV